MYCFELTISIISTQREAKTGKSGIVLGKSGKKKEILVYCPYREHLIPNFRKGEKK